MSERAGPTSIRLLGCYEGMLMSAARREHAHAFHGSVGFDGTAKHAFVVDPKNRSDPGHEGGGT